jgi:hypothetical protein
MDEQQWLYLSIRVELIALGCVKAVLVIGQPAGGVLKPDDC